MEWPVSMVSLQMIKCIGKVASRCCWVAGGGAVLLGNDWRFPWWNGVLREWHSRFPWWPGVVWESVLQVAKALDWIFPGVAGLRVVALQCDWRFLCVIGETFRLSIVARCYYSISLQVVKHNVMGASRWCWVVWMLALCF